MKGQNKLLYFKVFQAKKYHYKEEFSSGKPKCFSSQLDLQSSGKSTFTESS